jgi:hypothetical protein
LVKDFLPSCFEDIATLWHILNLQEISTTIFLKTCQDGLHTHLKTSLWGWQILA